MLPAAAVSGLYFSHPQAKYFNVGRIGRISSSRTRSGRGCRSRRPSGGSRRTCRTTRPKHRWRRCSSVAVRLQPDQPSVEGEAGSWYEQPGSWKLGINPPTNAPSSTSDNRTYPSFVQWCLIRDVSPANETQLSRCRRDSHCRFSSAPRPSCRRGTRRRRPNRGGDAMGRSRSPAGTSCGSSG